MTKRFYTRTRVSYIVEFSSFDSPIEIVEDDDTSRLDKTPRENSILKNILRVVRPIDINKIERGLALKLPKDLTRKPSTHIHTVLVRFNVLFEAFKESILEFLCVLIAPFPGIDARDACVCVFKEPTG